MSGPSMRRANRGWLGIRPRGSDRRGNHPGASLVRALTDHVTGFVPETATYVLGLERGVIAVERLTLGFGDGGARAFGKRLVHQSGFSIFSDFLERRVSR